MNAAQSNPEAIPLLLERGVSISTMLAAREKSHDGWSVLEHAVGFHNSRYVIDLLDSAHNFGILKTESERVQRRAMEYGNAPVLRYMKSRKYSLQPARDFFAGMTEKQQREREDCRHILPSSDVPRQPEADSGVFSQNPGAAREALLAGADPNQRNLQGDTPLHLAVVKHDSPELVELLLEHKADLAQKTQGYTPLQAASLFSQSCITPLLKTSLDKGLIRGERNFTMKNGLKTPRFCDESEDNGQQLLCGICHEVFRAGEMPILLPCFHHKCCSRCFTGASMHQYKGWYRYNSFQPFRCDLCQNTTRNVVNYSTGEIEYIAKQRRQQELGDSWKKYYDDKQPDTFHWPVSFQGSGK